MDGQRRKLPLVISVPHGGVLIPEGLLKKCLLTKEEILLDCDTWSWHLYDFKDLAEEYAYTEIARIVLDMNRSVNDRPPANPDGIVKTLSVENKQVWRTPAGLTGGEIENLIREHYIPFHERLEQATANPAVKLGIDCHTMLETGPAPDKKSWEKRPLFCISNRGSVTGESNGEPVTAPPELIQKLKDILENKFRGFEGTQGHTSLVSINTPFRGGYITRYHGTRGTIPWIQLEINRSLYLKNAANPASVLPEETDLRHLTKIRDILYEAFSELTG